MSIRTLTEREHAAIRAHDWLRRQSHEHTCTLRRFGGACDCGTGGSAAWRDVPQELRAGIGDLRMTGQVLYTHDGVRLRLSGVPWAPPRGGGE